MPHEKNYTKSNVQGKLDGRQSEIIEREIRKMLNETGTSDKAIGNVLKMFADSQQ